MSFLSRIGSKVEQNESGISTEREVEKLIKAPCNERVMEIVRDPRTSESHLSKLVGVFPSDLTWALARRSCYTPDELAKYMRKDVDRKAATAIVSLLGDAMESYCELGYDKVKEVSPCCPELEEVLTLLSAVLDAKFRDFCVESGESSEVFLRVNKLLFRLSKGCSHDQKVIGAALGLQALAKASTSRITDEAAPLRCFHVPTVLDMNQKAQKEST